MISNKSYTINIFCKYLVYFNKYSNLIGPNLLPSLYGQNLLDIACRSIIGIFLYPTCPDGTPVSFYVSKDTIQTITPVYFGNGDLVGTSLDSPQANPIPKEKKACKRWRTVCHFWWLQLTFGEIGRGCNQQLQTRIYH